MSASERAERLARRRLERRRRLEEAASGALDPAKSVDKPRRERRRSVATEGSAAEDADSGSRPARRARRPRGEGRGPEPVRTRVTFPDGAINADAAKVVRRLTEAGHEAYVVGGCVRDLLVGLRPKDFDVATSAKPEEVRAIFKNSRIIGRRFRLVHILYGAHVIETATFRRSPPPGSAGDAEDLLIRSDNVFGDAHEDAVRRDFTINALFYDPEEGEVLDWTSGMNDIAARVVQTIGEPRVRFLEDPVRILRAIKFAARLDFGIAPDVYDAIVQCRGALAQAARPRLSEEVMRLMRGGASERSFWLAFETGVLDVLLPELSTYVSDRASDPTVFRLLAEVDRRTAEQGEPLDDILLWSALLLEPLLEACEGSRDRALAAGDFLEPIVNRLNLPRRVSDAMRRIVALFPKLSRPGAERSKRGPLAGFAEELLEMRRAARAGLYVESATEEDADSEADEGTPKKRRRRRRH